MIKLVGQKSLQPKIETFPSYGFRSETGGWLVNVFGHVFQTPPLNLRQKMILKMLGNVMKASDAELQSTTFKNRVGPFFVEPLWRQRIQLEIGGRTFAMQKKSRRNGQFNQLGAARRSTGSRVCPTQRREPGAQFFRVDNASGDGKSGLRNRILESDGLSVVSDIDDTIKDSNVLDRRELLMNTFVRDYRCVDGMSAVYQKWREAGVDFHYVSSSPWQLLSSLQKMKSDNQFPDGSMHLRNFRLRDQFLKKLMIRRKGKANEIKKLIMNLPRRKFILVGDSGEKDPEIYLKICRRFPSQIKGVFIRDVGGRDLLTERLKKSSE